MRGCLTLLVLAGVTFLVGSWLFLPSVVANVVWRELNAAGFNGTPTSISVSSDPPIELLGGHADRISIGSRNATFHELSAATIDVTLTDVGLIDRTAGTVSGSLTGIRIVPVTGHVLPISSATLSGPCSAIEARLSLSLSDVNAIAAAAVTSAAGIAPSRVTLTSPDRATIVVKGITVSGRVAVDDQGGLVFRPAARGLPVVGTIDLIRPGRGVPLLVRTVALTSSGVVLTASIDLAALSG